MHSGDESQTKPFPDASDFVESLRASFQEKLQSGGATSIESWMERVPVPLKSQAFGDLLLIVNRTDSGFLILWSRWNPVST